jgi:hypothetical protein
MRASEIVKEMICIIAGNFDEALTFAIGQNIPKGDWFYPEDEKDLLDKENFHVLVVGSAGHNVPSSWFDKFYSLAQERGRRGR